MSRQMLECGEHTHTHTQDLQCSWCPLAWREKDSIGAWHSCNLVHFKPNFFCLVLLIFKRLFCDPLLSILLADARCHYRLLFLFIIISPLFFSALLSRFFVFCVSAPNTRNRLEARSCKYHPSSVVLRSPGDRKEQIGMGWLPTVRTCVA